MMHIRKKDKVVILSGKDKGKQGVVLEVDHKKRRVMVEKLNVVKRHTRRTQTDSGGIREKEALLPVSKVMLICPQTNRPTRTRIDKLADGTKVRISIRSGEIIN